jgi:hypothetical protein
MNELCQNLRKEDGQMKTADEIRDVLENCHVSRTLHRRLGKRIGLAYTDGVKQLAEGAGCYWLIDAIMSHMRTNFETRKASFCVWNLTCESKPEGGKSAVLTWEDGNGRELVRQRIGMTNFPLESITLWFDDFVLALPNEQWQPPRRLSVRRNVAPTNA